MTGTLRRTKPLRRRTRLFRRLFWTYAAVLTAAVAGLVLAPVTVSVPTALRELAVILAGFVLLLLLYRSLLRRALAPLERLTDLMSRVDPLTPGQRVESDVPDEEVATMAEAFNDMLDRLEGERRESGRRALAAQEAERQRIARELHDEIGQLLTGLILRSETVARRAPDGLRADVEDLREAARGAAQEVRTIAGRLRPEALDELGLQSALTVLCSKVGRESGVVIERRLVDDLRLPSEEELVVYRVAQEALTNVVRHSRATHVTLSLSADGASGPRLLVRDDGIGLPAGAEHRSSGIRGMRERALLVGATVELRPVEPQGTEVRLALPSKALV